MFCPRCGKDCKDAYFCPSCGQDLQAIHIGTQGSETAGDADRVRCPNCGSTSVAVHRDNRMKNEHLLYRNGFLQLLGFYVQEAREKKARAYGMECECLQCAHRWHPKLQKLNRQHMRFVSKLLENTSGMNYAGEEGTKLTLYKDCVVILKEGRKNCVIPFEEITAVSYQKNLGPLYGWITIRNVANRRKRFPRSYEEAKKDNMTVFYPFGHTRNYYDLYTAFKAIIEENKKAGVI